MSKLWERKMRTYFRRCDSNGDGLLTKDDFKSFSDKFCELEQPGCARRVTANEKMIKIFESWEQAGDKDGKLTEDELIEVLLKLRRDPKFRKTIEDAIHISFVLIDNNGDGYIDESDYVKFFYSGQIVDHENLAKSAFENLDTDHDGKLSYEEFRLAVTDFWFSEDEERPGTYFYGPLIEI